MAVCALPLFLCRLPSACLPLAFDVVATLPPAGHRHRRLPALIGASALPVLCAAFLCGRTMHRAVSMVCSVWRRRTSRSATLCVRPSPLVYQCVRCVCQLPFVVFLSASAFLLVATLVALLRPASVVQGGNALRCCRRRCCCLTTPNDSVRQDNNNNAADRQSTQHQRRRQREGERRAESKATCDPALTLYDARLSCVRCAQICRRTRFTAPFFVMASEANKSEQQTHIDTGHREQWASTKRGHDACCVALHSTAHAVPLIVRRSFLQLHPQCRSDRRSGGSSLQGGAGIDESVL